MRFSVQGDYVFDRVLVSKEKALWSENDLYLGKWTVEDAGPYRINCRLNIRL